MARTVLKMPYIAAVAFSSPRVPFVCVYVCVPRILGTHLLSMRISQGIFWWQIGDPWESQWDIIYPSGIGGPNV